ncbi:helix-turn-helix domain-containing protein [Solwaraspora sp. WMMA2059]|uniref:ArsR/SmtB family transcription factor n=1 Tax=Solwaraspora sp. WMMA2059 TaxID=3015160 RepID=UPI00248C8F97|nr:helix-turn-helix domain-containing protein [Solwaraspora sp. WMMA2059]WBB97448.1 helix-turn-helix domain-containing protein [Solwaraspora sp. WMMA2059]
MEDSHPRRISQAEALKAFTHPLRLRLYYALAGLGSATATTLAAEVGVTPQLAFYHLTRMAELGALEEDPAAMARGRERYWRHATRGLSFTQDNESKSVDDLDSLQRAQAAVHFEHLERYFSRLSDDDKAQSLAFSSDMVLELNEEDSKELQEKLTEILMTFRDRRSARKGKKVFVFLHAIPME